MLSIQDRDIRISYVGKISADGNEIIFTHAHDDAEWSSNLYPFAQYIFK